MLQTCTGCGRELEHIEENFHKQNGKLRVRCKQCHAKTVENWKQKNLVKYKKYQAAYQTQWREDNLDYAREREFHREMKKYGKTVEWFRSQEQVCRICGQPETEVDKKYGRVLRLSVDHDHRCCPERARSCGKCVRGLLCGKCNKMLFLLERVPGLVGKAFAYLAKYSVSQY